MAIDSGLGAWRQGSNHNRMMNSRVGTAAEGPVKLAYFGGSAFRITAPSGLTVMIDPWRNLPTRKWDWYFHDFPEAAVDIGISTHAHFDHDALHRLDASVLLDRLIGRYQFADIAITGIADKHATDATYAAYDFHHLNSYFGGQVLTPPDNARSWDNCLIKVEAGGLRVLHWGDNRHNPPDHVWEQLGPIDILLLPIDDSQHVLGYPMAAEVIARVKPRIVVPHHYYVWNVVQRQSTLLPVEKWIADQPAVRRLDRAEIVYQSEALPKEMTVDYFGDHVAFDVEAWHRENGSIPGGS